MRFLAMVAAAACLTAGATNAQDKFPSRAVKIVNSLAAGSATDVRARVIAAELTRIWGQQAIVENRPGGGGATSVQAVLGQPPDGHTLLAAPGSIFSLLPAQGELAFDVNRDLVPIGLTSVEPMIIAVSPKLGVASLPELVALAKREPGELVIGTNAAGSFPHLTARLIVERTGADFTILPYSSGGAVEAIKDVVAGRVHVMIDARAAMLGHIDAKELRPIAVMNDERMKSLPDVTATAEIMPGLRAVGWSGLAAPRGVSDAIVRQIAGDLRAVFANADVVKRLDTAGTPFTPLYGDDFRRFIAEEQKQWWPMVKAFNAK